MTQNVVWPPIGGSSFPVPEDGETNWAQLTDYLVALAQAQGTKAQKVAVRKITTTPATISAGNDCYVSVELGTPAPATVNLPAGNTGQYFGIIDGLLTAGTNNITVAPAPGETIQGDTEYIMNANGAAAGFLFLAGDWKIVWQAAGEGAGGGVARSSIDSATPNWVVINDGSGKLGQEQYLSSSRGGLGVNASAQSGYVKFTSGVPAWIASIPGTDLSGGIAASKIGNGDVDNPKLSFLNSVTSNVQTQLNNKQAADADLTAIAALATTGFAVRTAADTWALRVLQTGSGKISITNGDGVNASPTIDVVESAISRANLTGTTPIAGGGTGQTSRAAAINALLPTQAPNTVLQSDGTNVTFAVAATGYQTSVITANPAPAQNNVHYLTNTTSAPFTVTLPNGATGARIKISDDRGTWDVNNLTITPATGERIWPLAVNASLTCNVIRGWIELVWDGAGWSPNSLASTTLSNAGGGLTGVPATAAVNPAVNNTMYEADTTGGAFTITLPGGTSAAVVGVLDAGPFFSTNNLTIAPATGQFIDNGTVNETLVLDGNYQSIVLYRANGSSTWEIQVTPAVQYTPGFQPGSPGNSAIAYPYVGSELIGLSNAGAISNSSYTVPGTGYVDFTDPGNYDVSALAVFDRNGGTYTSVRHILLIGDVNVTIALRATLGENYVESDAVAPNAFNKNTLAIPQLRVRYDGVNIYFAGFSFATNRLCLIVWAGAFSGNTTLVSARIKARRV